MNNELATTNDNSRMMMLTQKTPANLIRFRKGRGGNQYPYVDGAEVIRKLNEIFAWDWDFETDQEELLHVNGKPFEIKVRGKLTVRVNGKTIVKMQYGAQAIEFLKDAETPVSLADCYKGAATDAMKKCASELGLFLDLYDSDAGITPQNVQQKQSQHAPQPTTTAPPLPAEAEARMSAATSGKVSIPSVQGNGLKYTRETFFALASSHGVTKEAAKIATAHSKDQDWKAATIELESVLQPA